MAATERAIEGRRVLVVEDEFLLAELLCLDLREAGAAVVGPAPDIDTAIGILDAGTPIDAAVLDVNLGGEKVFPVADALQARGIPFVFATGYDAWALPERFADTARCEKPINLRALLSALAA